MMRILRSSGLCAFFPENSIPPIRGRLRSSRIRPGGLILSHPSPFQHAKCVHLVRANVEWICHFIFLNALDGHDIDPVVFDKQNSYVTVQHWWSSSPLGLNSDEHSNCQTRFNLSYCPISKLSTKSSSCEAPLLKQAVAHLLSRLRGLAGQVKRNSASFPGSDSRTIQPPCSPRFFDQRKADTGIAHSLWPAVSGKS